LEKNRPIFARGKEISYSKLKNRQSDAVSDKKSKKNHINLAFA